MFFKLRSSYLTAAIWKPPGPPARNRRTGLLLSYPRILIHSLRPFKDICLSSAILSLIFSPLSLRMEGVDAVSCVKNPPFYIF